MSKIDEIRITVRFPLKDIEKLRPMAVTDNRSLNAEIVQAVQTFIARNRKKGKDAEKL
jgi:Arc-like DNA binding domain